MIVERRILIVTGSFPPDICGVGDYTGKLIEGFDKEGSQSVSLFYKTDWSFNNFFKYAKEIKKCKADIIHFQYPTEGFGYSFLPLVLVILFARNAVLTVHELSNKNFKGYIYTQFLVQFANKVIVSNEVEKKHAQRFLLRKSKVFVIPIGSNIQTSAFFNRPMDDREFDVAYFGHIRPLKGIENYLVVACALSNETRTIIGQKLEKYSDFFTMVGNKAAANNISIFVNRSESEVADLLANTKIVYLPFPDGVSNRRGTLLASINNGCQVVSLRSEQEKSFNSYFGKGCFLVNSNEEAITTIGEILRHKTAPLNTSLLSKDFAWDNIIVLHKKVYSSLYGRIEEK